MPSQACFHWQTDRVPRLTEVDGQCAASLAAGVPNARLADENLRGYVVLLSAHFQGFCRDLYTECSQIISSKVRPRLRLLVQGQFGAQIALDRGNPSHDNIKRDFHRLGFKLGLPDVNPANPVRLKHLGEMNDWRNVAAHQGTDHPPGVALNLANLRVWRDSCSGLAASLDKVLYDALRQILRRAPWIP